MLYPHQQRAIDYIIGKFQSDPSVKALLISGSIAHGFNDEKSDVDICIVVDRTVFGAAGNVEVVLRRGA